MRVAQNVFLLFLIHYHLFIARNSQYKMCARAQTIERDTQVEKTECNLLFGCCVFLFCCCFVSLRAWASVFVHTVRVEYAKTHFVQTLKFSRWISFWIFGLLFLSTRRFFSFRVFYSWLSFESIMNLSILQINWPPIQTKQNLSCIFLAAFTRDQNKEQQCVFWMRHILWENSFFSFLFHS